MDNWIEQMQALTDDFVHRLEIATYEEIEDFVENRQNFVDLIVEGAEVSPLDYLQQKRLKDILQYDEIIVSRMMTLKSQASDFLQQRGKARMSRRAYEVHYIPDSILMDKKN